MVGIAPKLLLVINADWCVHGNGHEKKLRTKNLIALSNRRSQLLGASSDAQVKFRSLSGKIVLDNDARLIAPDDLGGAFLCSPLLASDIRSRQTEDALFVFLIEQSDGVLRITVQFVEAGKLRDLGTYRPELRLDAYDLPPTTVTDIEPTSSKDGMDYDSLYEILLTQAQEADFTAHRKIPKCTPYLGPVALTFGKPERRGEPEISTSASAFIGSSAHNS